MMSSPSGLNRLLPLLLGLGGLAACGASNGAASSGDRAAEAMEAPAPTEDAAAPAASSEKMDTASDKAKAAQVTESASVPEACDEARGDDCVPPAAWVNKLCNGVFAEVALVMFRGGTPWQRLYLRGKTRAVNASGGATVEGFLTRDEEVLVLRHRTDDAGGMQIGDGSGQYDVLRWDGSCVSLEGGEVTSRKPSNPGQAHIEWRWLGQGMRGALRKDEALNETYQARQKECKGATTGSVSKACEKLDSKLVAKIAAHVRSGSELPAPEDHP